MNPSLAEPGITHVWQKRPSQAIIGNDICFSFLGSTRIERNLEKFQTNVTGLKLCMSYVERQSIQANLHVGYKVKQLIFLPKLWSFLAPSHTQDICILF